MIEWRRVPWPLWIYSAVAFFDLLRLEFRVHGPALAMVIYTAFSIAWLYFLLRGVRWIWLGTVALLVLGLAYDLVAGSLLRWVAALGVIELILLLLPVTRSYFSKETVPTAADPG